MANTENAQLTGEPKVRCDDGLEWRVVEQGKPLPGDVMLAVLREGERLQIMWKVWPEWPPITGWSHYYPLPPL